MRIDAHQHFWRLAERAGLWPPPELAAIHRDFMPPDLWPILAASEIAGTVLVQSQPVFEDNQFMLELAARHAFILGVVGWVDLKDAQAPLQIMRLAQQDKFKGVRPMLQDLPDPAWIADPALDPAIQALQQADLSFDALVLPHHLPALALFARRHPTLPIVIDHAAKPPIAAAQLRPWQADLAALAALPNVSCKLSGLLTEAQPGAGAQALAPYVDTVLDLFGPQRVIWGSDWPVLRLAADYRAWYELAGVLCSHWYRRREPAGSSLAQILAAVFGGNAQRFYRLESAT